MTITKDLETIREAKEAAARIKQAADLVNLPKQFGFETVKELRAALADLEDREDEIRSLARSLDGSTGTKATKGTRKRLNDFQKKEIADSLRDGKKAKHLAAEYGVSIATINKLKAGQGLTAKKKVKKRR